MTAAKQPVLGDRNYDRTAEGNERFRPTPGHRRIRTTPGTGEVVVWAAASGRVAVAERVRSHGILDVPLVPNEEKLVSVAGETPDEVGIAERYLSVLADMSGCADAVRDGDWRRLADTADGLCRRAALLAEVAGRLEHAGTGPRGDVVAALVAARNGSSHAARLLHPGGPAMIPKTVMTDPFTHPGAQPAR